MSRGPDFGGQKCGTTSLYRYLREHPSTALGRVKETHFFDRPASARAVERYLDNFNSGTMVTGEATPYYLFHPHAPRRVASAAPNARLIVLLRNPADRAISQYHHEGDRTPMDEAMDLDGEALRAEVKKMLADERHMSHVHQRRSYCARGEYAIQLEHWFKFFPREQFMIIRSETLYTDPATTCEEVFEFLGLTPFKIREFPVHHKGKYDEPDPAIRERLLKHFEPHNRRLYDLLGADYGWS